MLFLDILAKFLTEDLLYNLETDFQFVLTLDTEAELLWQVPWEYLHDSEEFLGLSGNVHVVRTPPRGGAGSLRVSAISPPLKILVVVSNPIGEGEFDSERTLAAIQEALDYSRRLCWVELDYLEEVTFAHFQSRLVAFQPHNDQTKIASRLHELGLTLNQLNRPQEAFTRFQESLKITEKSATAPYRQIRWGRWGNC
jgi:hypothetical protein